MTGPAGFDIGALAVLPMGQPMLVSDVLVGSAITDGGPAVLAVFTDGSWTAALQWQTAELAERHLVAMLAHVRSQMPLPPVAQLVTR